MAEQKVSLSVIKRLPRYYRYVQELRAKDVKTISSSGFADMMGTTASQVRQDFNCFGGFGQQGIGYSVEVLYKELQKLLFSDKELKTILVGTGRLGRAISGFLLNEAQGFRLVAAFDKEPEEIGTTVAGMTIQDVATLQEYCKKEHPQVAVLCVPKEGAQELAPMLSELGVQGFWNFSYLDLKVEITNAVVENVHLGDSLMSLGYQVRQEEK